MRSLDTAIWRYEASNQKLERSVDLVLTPPLLENAREQMRCMAEGLRILGGLGIFGLRF